MLGPADDGERDQRGIGVGCHGIRADEAGQILSAARCQAKSSSECSVSQCVVAIVRAACDDDWTSDANNGRLLFEAGRSAEPDRVRMLKTLLERLGKTNCAP